MDLKIGALQTELHNAERYHKALGIETAEKERELQALEAKVQRLMAAAPTAGRGNPARPAFIYG